MLYGNAEVYDNAVAAETVDTKVLKSLQNKVNLAKIIDVCCTNNKIIVNHNIFHIYEENSYLSLVTLLNDLLKIEQ